MSNNSNTKYGTDIGEIGNVLINVQLTHQQQNDSKVNVIVVSFFYLTKLRNLNDPTKKTENVLNDNSITEDYRKYLMEVYLIFRGLFRLLDKITEEFFVIGVNSTDLEKRKQAFNDFLLHLKEVAEAKENTENIYARLLLLLFMELADKGKNNQIHSFILKCDVYQKYKGNSALNFTFRNIMGLLSTICTGKKCIPLKISEDQLNTITTLGQYTIPNLLKRTFDHSSKIGIQPAEAYNAITQFFTNNTDLYKMIQLPLTINNSKGGKITRKSKSTSEKQNKKRTTGSKKTKVPKSKK